MMGLQMTTFITTFLTCISVPVKNLLAPYSQTMTIASALPLERFSIFIGGSFFASHVFATTADRAITLLCGWVTHKLLLAVFALFLSLRTAIRPTLAGTILRGFRTIFFYFIAGITDRADFDDLRVSSHTLIIPCSPDYCAVILERMAGMGLNPERLV